MSSSGASIIYWNDDLAAWDPALVAEKNGFALLMNAGATASADVSYQGTAFPAHPTGSTAGELTITWVDPR